jgi:hypothetical protein
MSWSTWKILRFRRSSRIGYLQNQVSKCLNYNCSVRKILKISPTRKHGKHIHGYATDACIPSLSQSRTKKTAKGRMTEKVNVRIAIVMKVSEVDLRVRWTLLKKKEMRASGTGGFRSRRFRKDEKKETAAFWAPLGKIVKTPLPCSGVLVLSEKHQNSHIQGTVDLRGQVMEVHNITIASCGFAKSSECGAFVCTWERTLNCESARPENIYTFCSNIL